MLDIIFKKIEGDFQSLEQQRLAAKQLVFDMIGPADIKHTKTGRPDIGSEFDISISHKDDAVCVGIVASPYRIGVDVEHVICDVNSKLFLQSVIIKKERDFFLFFCKKNNINENSGLAIFWSIKESFFKCLDHDLMPAKISIVGVDKNGFIDIEMQPSIKDVLNKLNLKVCYASVTFDKKNVFTRVVMRKID